MIDYIIDFRKQKMNFICIKCDKETNNLYCCSNCNYASTLEFSKDSFFEDLKKLKFRL